ncbi:MAG: hypothetical protein IKL40_03560 [Clostridia bacterium]|nr:hypothetical protein [Clostridia bacterium]
MQKKEIIKPEYLIKDIASSIECGHQMSKKEYIISSVAIVVSVLLLPIIAICFIEYNIISDIAVFLMVLGALLGVMFYCLYIPLSISFKIRNINLDDYETEQLTLTHKKSDEYNTSVKIRRKSYRGNTLYAHVSVYTLVFGDDIEWQIPNRMYTWNDGGSSSGVYVFENSNIGDKFITVINKKTRKIAVAYDTKIFEYDKKRQWETSL